MAVTLDLVMTSWSVAESCTGTDVDVAAGSVETAAGSTAKEAWASTTGSCWAGADAEVGNGFVTARGTEIGLEAEEGMEDAFIEVVDEVAFVFVLLVAIAIEAILTGSGVELTKVK